MYICMLQVVHDPHLRYILQWVPELRVVAEQVYKVALYLLVACTVLTGCMHTTYWLHAHHLLVACT